MTTDLQAQLEATYAIADEMASEGLEGFLRWWVIDSSPPEPLHKVIRPFQVDRFQRLRPAIESIAGFRDYDGPRGFWNVCARGYDKSGSIARLIVWVVAYSKIKTRIVVAAGDQDQASIIYDAAKQECELNPWIAKRITFTKNSIVGKGGEVKILTADAPSSYGLRPDLIVCDEITWWEKRDLWDALFTARNKRPKCVTVIISNAGVLKSWQHELWCRVKIDPRWIAWETDPLTNPTWMSQADIDADAKLLPSSVAKRLYYNVWIDASEECGYLLRSDVEACIDPELQSHFSPKPGFKYALGIDYGPKQNRTVLSRVKQSADGIIDLDECTVWQGTPENEVELDRVEDWLSNQIKRFPTCNVMVDEYQLLSLIQKFSPRKKIMRYNGKGPTGNFRLAELLRTVILNRRFRFAPGTATHPTIPGDDLVEELSSLVIKHLPGRKYKFDHEINKNDDRACSIGMALIALHEEYLPGTYLKPKPVPNPSGQFDIRKIAADKKIHLFGLKFRLPRHMR